jgi:hypothetical protein
MKKLGFYFSVVLMLVFVSCSNDSDDDNMTISNKTVAGHWKSVTSHGYNINLNTGEKIDYEEKTDESLSFKLYEDGTCKYSSGMGIYKLLGKELDIEVSYYTNGYDREGNTIKRLVEISRSYVIEELKSDKMVLSYVGHGFNSDSSGERINWEWKTTYTMTRVSQ